jgi:hypothetical protein
MYVYQEIIRTYLYARVKSVEIIRAYLYARTNP